MLHPCCCSTSWTFTCPRPAAVKDAAAISQAIITGGSVAGALFALFQVHPLQPDKPLIDFDLALLLIPSLLLGTSIGEIAT